MPSPIYGSGNYYDLASLPVYDVKKYGATGDGTTVDLTAFRSAVSALPAGGGTIHVPAGTYNLGTIGATFWQIAKTNVAVIGQGIGVSTIKYNSSGRTGTFGTGSALVVGDNSATYSSFTARGLTFTDANTTTATGSGHNPAAIDSTYVNQITVEDCEFVNIKGNSAVNFIGQLSANLPVHHDLTIFNCIFRGDSGGGWIEGDGINFGNYYNVNVTGNTVSGANRLLIEGGGVVFYANVSENRLDCQSRGLGGITATGFNYSSVEFNSIVNVAASKGALLYANDTGANRPVDYNSAEGNYIQFDSTGAGGTFAIGIENTSGATNTVDHFKIINNFINDTAGNGYGLFVYVDPVPNLYVAGNSWNSNNLIGDGNIGGTFGASTSVVVANNKGLRTGKNTSGGSSWTSNAGFKTHNNIVLQTIDGSDVFARSGANTDITSLSSPALGTPASGVVTNLTGTASININGTVGATTPATGAFTSETFSLSSKSTTALATPPALSATQYTGFASTVSGASIMGYGTTNDVSLMNRAGTVAFGIDANTTNATAVGNLAVNGATTTLGSGGAATDSQLIINGGTNSGNGPYINIKRGGTNKGYIGTSSAILGGTSDDLTFSSSGASSQILLNPGISASVNIRQGNLIFTTDNTYDIGASGATRPRDLYLGRNINVAGASTFTGAVTQTAKTTTYNNIATVSNGVPSELATIDSTGLTANVTASTLYAIPASGAGLYRVSAYLVTTTAASVSSTMPNAQVVYTDSDSNTSVTLDVSPILGAAGLGQSGLLTANAVGTVFSGTVVVYIKASTTIQYQTVNYASTAGGMAYALRMKLEAL